MAIKEAAQIQKLLPSTSMCNRGSEKKLRQTKNTCRYTACLILPHEAVSTCVVYLGRQLRTQPTLFAEQTILCFSGEGRALMTGSRYLGTPFA